MDFNISIEALNHLSKIDSDLEKIIKKYGVLKIKLENDLFVAIVSNIIGQQLSNKAATTIYNRFIDLVKEIEPSIILTIDNETIRTCGISNSKIAYIKELCQKIVNGQLQLTRINELSDEEIFEELLKIKGIGKWTAEMLMLFSLGRQNIFSFDDVALKNSLMQIKGYKSISKIRFERLRKKYSPYCSVASVYLYHQYDMAKIKI